MGTLLGGRAWNALGALGAGLCLSFATLPAAAQGPNRFVNPVVVIPGVMGSRLERNGEVLWGHSIWTMKDKFEKLALPADLSDDGIRSTDVMRDLRVIGRLFTLKEYTDLLRYLKSEGLEEGKTLFVFHYDWRRSNLEAAQQLAAQIEKWRRTLPKPDARFRLVAHSMGGLVAKYYVNRLQGDQRVDRLILLGTPTAGSLKSVMMFRGGLLDDSVNNFIGEERVRRVLRTFPSAYELLPRTKSCCLEKGPAGKLETLNIFSLAPWQRFGWIAFRPAEAAAGWKGVEAHLRGAQAFHHALYGVATKVEIFKVVGYTQDTLDQLVMEPAAGGFQAVLRTGRGDGTVTVDSASLGDLLAGDLNSNVQRVSEKHGSIYVDGGAQATILDLVRERRAPPVFDLYSAAASSVSVADATLDRPYFKPGEQASLRLDVRDNLDRRIAAEHVTLRIGGQALAATRVEGAPDAPIVYRFATPQAPGTYEVVVSIALRDLPSLRVTELFEVVE